MYTTGLSSGARAGAAASCTCAVRPASPPEPVTQAARRSSEGSLAPGPLIEWRGTRASPAASTTQFAAGSDCVPDTWSSPPDVVAEVTAGCFGEGATSPTL